MLGFHGISAAPISALEDQGAVAQDITGALYTNTNTFYGATVGRGAVTITGVLYSDTDTFYAATIGRGSVTITAALYADADTFYGATVGRGAVNISGALHTDADTFYGATLSTSYAITGALYTDTDTFYQSTVSQVGADQDITAELFTDDDTFYGAIISTPAVFVQDDFDTHDGKPRKDAHDIIRERYLEQKRDLEEIVAKRFRGETDEEPEQPEPEKRPSVKVSKRTLYAKFPGPKPVETPLLPEVPVEELIRRSAAREAERLRIENDEIAIVMAMMN